MTWFVDTNVLVYARDSSEPVKQAAARRWLERLWREQSGRVSFQVLQEYYVTVTQKLSPGLEADDAFDDVRSFFAWNPVAAGSEIVMTARNLQERYRFSWWDSTMLAAAKHCGCEGVLTEDLRHGQTVAGMVIRSPFL